MTLQTASEVTTCPESHSSRPICWEETEERDRESEMWFHFTYLTVSLDKEEAIKHEFSNSLWVFRLECPPEHLCGGWGARLRLSVMKHLTVAFKQRELIECSTKIIVDTGKHYVGFLLNLPKVRSLRPVAGLHGMESELCQGWVMAAEITYDDGNFHGEWEENTGTQQRKILFKCRYKY